MGVRMAHKGTTEAAESPKADPTSIADLTADPANRRRRTARGARMLVDALANVGAARSIVIDEHNEILAGNGVVDAATEAGLTKLQIVEADGDTLIAVRRRGLSPEKKRDLALYDNRTAELSEWVPEQIADDKATGRPLAPFFNEAELRGILGDPNKREPTVTEVGDVGDQFWIAVRGPLKFQAHALQRLLDLMRDLDGVDVALGTIEAEAWTG